MIEFVQRQYDFVRTASIIFGFLYATMHVDTIVSTIVFYVSCIKIISF